MEALTALIAITLANIDLCCIVYLTKTGLKAVFKLIDLKELLEKDK